jgi:hypothetical protein
MIFYDRNSFVIRLLLVSALLFSLSTVAGVASAKATAAPTGHVSQSRKAWVMQQAKIWLQYFQQGKVENPQALSAEVRSQLTEQVLKSESLRLRRLGKPLSFSYLGSEPIKGMTGYYVLVQFASARVVEALAFDRLYKIAGIDFKELDKVDPGAH